MVVLEISAATLLHDNIVESALDIIACAQSAVIFFEDCIICTQFAYFVIAESVFFLL